MDTLESCLNLMERGCYMASIDLENAYHSVPIHSEYTKFLKFKIDDQLYKYLVLPQGYRDSPRIFTKLTKPIISHLHERGILYSLYIDDLYIQGSDFADCQQKVEYASSVLKSLGFDISPKSALTPSQEIHHLGFILNSEYMTVTLSGDKREHVETLINKVLLTPMITVRTLAQTVGTLTACFPAIEYGQLYHRHLDILKINSLKTVYDFERLILLSEEAMSDLKWWLNDGLKSKKSLVREKPRATIKSDSSGYAWGAVMNNTDSGRE
ncbi:Gag-Pol polyprotein [Plakobranchus ocellatus]|uniref:Gag-Pol polyprotein n=1 Tax=Plakobranchus ocellatus TaxID=259542 RepID=A0AAV4ALW8_9GAST|nr:Gag-Pol polyprotein [Plakobranchus ocellatus]